MIAKDGKPQAGGYACGPAQRRKEHRLCNAEPLPPRLSSVLCLSLTNHHAKKIIATYYTSGFRVRNPEVSQKALIPQKIAISNRIHPICGLTNKGHTS
jgi:hypothetical protein